MRHISGLRNNLALKSVRAANISGGPAEQKPTRRHQKTTTLSKAARSTA
jgi:hypothetical protein